MQLPLPLPPPLAAAPGGMPIQRLQRLRRHAAKRAWGASTAALQVLPLPPPLLRPAYSQTRLGTWGPRALRQRLLGV